MNDLKRAARAKKKPAKSGAVAEASAAARRRRFSTFQADSRWAGGRKLRLLKYRRSKPHGRFSPTLQRWHGGIRKRQLMSIAQNAGRRYGSDHPIPSGSEPKAWLQSVWAGFWYSPQASRIPRSLYREAAEAFCQGCRSNCEVMADSIVLLPTHRTVGAVITAMNEERSLPNVLEQLGCLPLNETIIIVNGSNDRTLDYARLKEDAIVLHYADPLGHDVGRAIGAKLSSADIVIFLDGDVVFEPEQLARLVYAVETGVDVALNDLSPFLGVFRGRDSVTIVKEFLNRALGRPDLKASSLIEVPHALSRRAIQTIGYRELMVPPKAHALAITSGLRVEAPVCVDVVPRNKMRRNNVGAINDVERLIMGDHIEALHAVMASDGARLRFADDMRRRL